MKVISSSYSSSTNTIKVGVIAPLTGQYGSLGESFKNVLSIDAEFFKQGIASTSMLVNETRVSSGTDFRSEVTKILASNPDAVTNIFALADGIKFIKELNAQKGKKKISLICDVNTEFALADYIKAVGTSTFEGCISTNLPNLTSSSFKQLYFDKYGSNPLIGADWGFDAMTIVKSLVGVTKDQWTEKIQAASFNGVSGPVKFDESGTRLAASERHIFKNGQFIKLEE
ncbi:MAG: ABC transporter substrate-binding protein [Candidatus Taylorbacteria bacterium]